MQKSLETEFWKIRILQHFSKWWRHRVPPVCELLVFYVLYTSKVLNDEVLLREALRLVKLMWLQHAHTNINDTVHHAHDSH